ncbi:MAG: sulfatase-like hydrolase/transferase, partial [Anaerolineae bacterium]|nr:sulfatase-like hydrolase/transferase [Anaerolineae bacterium]
VVLIDCHDLGTWLGCYGWSHVASPHLDELAREGALMTQQFATAPICIPSRAGLYSGYYPQRVGCYAQDPLDEDAICVARRLREGGYRTALCGRFKLRNDPAWAGYEQQAPFGPESSQVGAWLAELACGEGPFFAHLSFGLVHRPFGATFDGELALRLEVPPSLPDIALVRADLASFYRNIAELDAHVGRILADLEALGLAERTLLIFTTDHGPALVRAKHTLYDAGLRTALIWRWPGQVAAGVRHDALLSNLDLLPTLLDLVKLSVSKGLDGRSYARMLRLGQLSARARRVRSAVFGGHSWGIRAGLWHYTPARCMRTRRHKLIHNVSPTPPYVDSGWLARFGPDRDLVECKYGNPSMPYELYDLESDPWEQRNLVEEATHRALCDRLAAQLEAHLRQVGDRILRGPVPNKAGQPDTPLWERQEDDSYRLRAYNPDEDPERPILPRSVDEGDVPQ